MRCLLVDDEPGIREGLAALLRRKGHEVHTAGDCATASSRLVDAAYDVVITDWRLTDGTASAFLSECECPVFAISGHPEEVEAHPAVHEVLTKPVLPARLLEAIARAASRPESDAEGQRLPQDTRLLVDAAIQVLLHSAPVTIEDDGTLVVLRAPLIGDSCLRELEALGGDLRVLAPGGVPQVELRWCRDGRPDLAMPVVAPTASWPENGDFAVDFDGAEIAPAGFSSCLDQVLAARRRGQCVHFLNVPESLRFWASSQARDHDMPMRTRVGPRLPAVLADLWS